MFHLAGFFGSLGVGPANVPALVDPALTIIPTGSQYQFMQPLKLKAAYAMGALLVSMRIESPTLRIVNIPYIRPINPTAAVRSNDQPLWFEDQPFRLPALEAIGPVAVNSGAGPTNTYCLFWLELEHESIPHGQIITMRATSTGTAVAGAWTLMTFQFDQQLPGGNYAIVGSNCISTTGIAHRFAFTNKQWRPGSLSNNATGDLPNWHLAERGLGMYGTFLNTSPPQLDVLCDAADAAHELYIQIVPLSIPGFQGQSPVM